MQQYLNDQLSIPDRQRQTIITNRSFRLVQPYKIMYQLYRLDLVQDFQTEYKGAISFKLGTRAFSVIPVFEIEGSIGNKRFEEGVF